MKLKLLLTMYIIAAYRQATLVILNVVNNYEK